MLLSTLDSSAHFYALPMIDYILLHAFTIAYSRAQKAPCHIFMTR